MMPTKASTIEGLFETAPDTVLAVDSGGRVTPASAQVEALFGYTRSELFGQPVDILVPDAASDAHAAHRARYAHNPTTRSRGVGLQLSARRKDGTEFSAEISLSSTRSTLLVEVMLHLARALGVSVVAEGIERANQADTLRAYGCTLGQGYLYSPPVPAAAIEALLTSQTA
jgi:PAS domain S-box-containing protein